MWEQLIIFTFGPMNAWGASEKAITVESDDGDYKLEHYLCDIYQPWGSALFMIGLMVCNWVCLITPSVLSGLYFFSLEQVGTQPTWLTYAAFNQVFCLLSDLAFMTLTLSGHAGSFIGLSISYLYNFNSNFLLQSIPLFEILRRHQTSTEYDLVDKNLVLQINASDSNDSSADFDEDSGGKLSGSNQSKEEEMSTF